jgi:DMSO/TMAO reductase YedYZ molybdopterin-dependent catalytic subunit
MTPTRQHLLPRRLAAAGSGLLAGTAGVAASEAVTTVIEGVSSPLLAVANRAVDAAPRPLKELAIATFGTADKAVLIGSVIATVAALAALIGVVGLGRLRAAAGIFLALSAVAAVAALTDRAATAGPVARMLPVAALVVVGLGSLLVLLRALRPLPDVAQPRPAGARKAEVAASAPVETLEPGGKRRLRLPHHVPGDDLPAAFDRRGFLRAVTAVGAIAAAGGVTSQVLGGSAAGASRAGVRVPVPDVAAPALTDAMTLDVPGITPYLTANRDFYRVDTALQVPAVPVDTWRLRIHGMVERELELSFEDLLDRRLVERRITLTCVSNPVGGEYVGNATWIGVPMRDLLREAGVRDGADAVRSTSVDDFTIGTPLQALLDDDRDALVAVAMNGEPLPLEHGFPVRMVTPGLYGYVSATKWLVDLEVTRFADFSAYWTSRGYAAEAPIKTSSRIDVPRSFARVRAGRVPVAGVAWSQDRGITTVEVRVDGGTWSAARLPTQDSVDTWRQWVWDWDAEPGNHTLEVRATDATGSVQTADRAPIAPDGSTGWHSVNVTVE